MFPIECTQANERTWLAVEIAGARHRKWGNRGLRLGRAARLYLHGVRVFGAWSRREHLPRHIFTMNA